MLQQQESLAWYPGAFDQADEVIVTKMSFSKLIPKDKRVTGRDIVSAIRQTQLDVTYQPVDEEVIDLLLNRGDKGKVIIFMSSGGQRVPKVISLLRSALLSEVS